MRKNTYNQAAEMRAAGESWSSIIEMVKSSPGMAIYSDRQIQVRVYAAVKYREGKAASAGNGDNNGDETASLQVTAPLVRPDFPEAEADKPKAIWSQLNDAQRVYILARYNELISEGFLAKEARETMLPEYPGVVMPPPGILAIHHSRGYYNSRIGRRAGVKNPRAAKAKLKAKLKSKRKAKLKAKSLVAPAPLQYEDERVVTVKHRGVDVTLRGSGKSVLDLLSKLWK